MSHIYKTRTFTRWMRKTDLTDEVLYRAVAAMSEGLVDVVLGGNLIKKRIAIPGRGKRSGARTIVATNHCGRWFYLYGFEKSERANISKDELKALQELAYQYLSLNANQLQLVVSTGKLTEVYNENEKKQKPDSSGS